MSADFENAVDAVVNGDVATLERMLRADPDLVRARSAREHHAMLLHYAGANGVEDERQRTPKNIVEVARLLLDAGADIHAMADIYRGSDTFSLAATSCHPRDAGVQIPLLEFLIGRGATFDATTLNACLANGRPEAAEFLAARLGDALDLEAAAGVGRLDLLPRLVDDATDAQKRAGFAWACEYGRTEAAMFLLDHGVPIDARVPPHGGTGLHWAAHEGHVELVNALLSRGAPVDVRDQTFDGTPLEWAEHGGHPEVAAVLRRHQA
jgi:ankyrin repeat protein